MEAGCGDEGCDQANEVIVHVAWVAQGGCACRHDGGHLCVCVCVRKFAETYINFNLIKKKKTKTAVVTQYLHSLFLYVDFIQSLNLMLAATIS